MSVTDPAALAARFRQALMPLMRQLRTNVEEGITPGQMSALGSIARQGRMSLGELAAAERVTPPMATKLAKALEELGLVERLPGVDDRRVVRLQLAPEGRSVLQRARRRRDAWLAERFADLSVGEREALAAAVTVFERINDQVETVRS